jgi:hypothetical protein
MARTRPEIEILRTLLARLERISVDSHWSHQANGIRRLLLFILEQNEKSIEVDEADLSRAIYIGHEILVRAAKEMGKGNTSLQKKYPEKIN